MQFTQPEYLAFLAFTLIAVFFTASRFRIYVLLAVSLLFAAFFNWQTVVAVVACSFITFSAAKRGSKNLVTAVIVMNALSILLFNFTTAFIDWDAAWNTYGFPAILLAAGLSFYNLQHIAYLVDVSHRRIVAENRFCDFLLCSVWFPKLASGPLMRYQELRPQFDKLALHVSGGSVHRLALGFFKKLCIADRLAAGVASVYDHQDEVPGITILAAAVMFTVQLYFDFSGYTDIAIASSEMLGIRLSENFLFPLRATSVTEFWRRWHRSLMDFLRIYIFTPLAFRMRGAGKHATIVALAVTFLVSAIWHGMGITFLLWAACHFIYLTFEFYSRDRIRANRATDFLGVIWVWLAVSFSNVFFRSTSASECQDLVSHLVCGNFFAQDWLTDFIAPLATGGHQIDRFNFYVTVLLAVSALVAERQLVALTSGSRLRPWFIALLLLVILLFGGLGDSTKFIYMQF